MPVAAQDDAFAADHTTCLRFKQSLETMEGTCGMAQPNNSGSYFMRYENFRVKEVTPFYDLREEKNSFGQLVCLTTFGQGILRSVDGDTGFALVLLGEGPAAGETIPLPTSQVTLHESHRVPTFAEFMAEVAREELYGGTGVSINNSALQENLARSSSYTPTNPSRVLKRGGCHNDTAVVFSAAQEESLNRQRMMDTTTATQQTTQQQQFCTTTSSAFSAFPRKSRDSCASSCASSVDQFNQQFHQQQIQEKTGDHLFCPRALSFESPLRTFSFTSGTTASGGSVSSGSSGSDRALSEEDDPRTSVFSNSPPHANQQHQPTTFQQQQQRPPPLSTTFPRAAAPDDGGDDMEL